MALSILKGALNRILRFIPKNINTIMLFFVLVIIMLVCYQGGGGGGK